MVSSAIPLSAHYFITQAPNLGISARVFSNVEKRWQNKAKVHSNRRKQQPQTTVPKKSCASTNSFYYSTNVNVAGAFANAFSVCYTRTGQTPRPQRSCVQIKVKRCAAPCQ